MTILVLDFMNACHRARSGFTSGDHSVVFNFFRGLRALVEQFKPTCVYVVDEGTPRARRALLPEYKANRVVSDDDPRRAELAKFFAQVDLIRDIIKNYFPVSFVRHPDYEADDTIANLVERSSSSASWVIVSSDTDFIQLLGQDHDVKLYNPVRKEYVDCPPDYSYLVWKALRGDPTDNVPGIPGVGDKTAVKLARSLAGGIDEFAVWLAEDPERHSLLERNMDLIGFEYWDDESARGMTCSTPQPSWSDVVARFESYGFKSLLQEKTWTKFTSTFDTLWGGASVS